MIDQANDLRRLVTQAAKPSDDALSTQMPTVLVAGGKGGVGTTTVAVNLAVAAAQQGVRTVLVDADPDGPDVQTLCRLRQRHTISDVLSGRRTLVEALQPGPGGVMILAGAWAAADLADASETNQRRLIDQISSLATRADLVVIDGGNGLHGFTRRLWQTCHDLILVSSTDAAAVLDAYAALKVALDVQRPPHVHVLVNMCTDGEEALEVHDRLRRSTQRFLGFDLPRYHWLSTDTAIACAGRQGVPIALSAQCTTTTETLQTLALTFVEATATRKEPKQDNLQVRLNPDEENADSEEDRSLLARC